MIKIFLKGKRMWGYIIGTLRKPINKKEKKKCAEQLDAWEASNSKIITWINNCIDNLISIQLAKYETAKEIREHLERLYTQSKFPYLFVGYESKFYLFLFVIYESKFHLSLFVGYKTKFCLTLFVEYESKFCLSLLLSLFLDLSFLNSFMSTSIFLSLMV